MRTMVLCFVLVACADAALAQEINPNVLAPAARQALPRNEVICEAPRCTLPPGAARPGRHRRLKNYPPRPPIQNGDAPFWPWD